MMNLPKHIFFVGVSPNPASFTIYQKGWEGRIYRVRGWAYAHARWIRWRGHTAMVFELTGGEWREVG